MAATHALRPSPSVGSRLARGLAAGAAAVQAMDLVTQYLWDRESPAVRAREERARPGGLDPAHVLTNRLARAVLGRELTPRQPHPAAIALHYLFGAAPGLWYGTTRGRPPTVAQGALLGFVLFLVQDELGNRVLKSSGPLRAYPWQAHARGLVGHVVYGAALAAAVRALGARR